MMVLTQGAVGAGGCTGDAAAAGHRCLLIFVYTCIFVLSSDVGSYCFYYVGSIDKGSICEDQHAGTCIENMYKILPVGRLDHSTLESWSKKDLI